MCPRSDVGTARLLVMEVRQTLYGLLVRNAMQCTNTSYQRDKLGLSAKIAESPSPDSEEREFICHQTAEMTDDFQSYKEAGVLRQTPIHAMIFFYSRLSSVVCLLIRSDNQCEPVSSPFLSPPFRRKLIRLDWTIYSLCI